MSYKFINGQINGNTPDVHVVDLRSDTISHPTEEMRQAMVNASVGDDVFGEDPTVNELLERCCRLFNKEDAIFLPSGTMANLISIMVHSNQRGCEIIAGDLSHTYKCEQGGPSQIAGVQQCILKNKPDGTFCLEELEENIRIDPDCHEAKTSLIVVENTHNMCGGRVLPLEWLDKLSAIAKKYGIPIHMDGARIMNAAVASKTHPSRIVRDIDTVCFCLSKGLGAPTGSVLLGSKHFIDRAKRIRKVLGGGMRQNGFVAAAGLVALDKMIDRLEIDHGHGYKVAKAINSMNCKWLKTDLDRVQTNILMIKIDKSKINVRDFLYRLASVHESDSTKVSVMAAFVAGNVRFVFYWEITDDDTDAVIEKLKIVADEFNNKITTTTTTTTTMMIK